MSKIRRFFTLSIIFLTLSSCVHEAWSMPKSWDWGLRGRPYMARGLPDGDDDYTKGFRDGCKSSFGIAAQGMLRNIKPEFDGWLLTQNRVYAAGFFDGEEHCLYLLDNVVA